MKSRLLSLLLAALLCAGLFSVIPASAASGQIAYWDAADLAAAATQTGADNGAGGPIFTTENQAIGVQLMTDGYRVAAGGFAIPIYDAEGNELIYEGDTIRFEAYLWVEEEELEAGAHAARIRMLWPDSDMQAYNDKIGPTQPNMDTLIVSRDNFRALETMYDDTYGDYKIVSMEHTFTGEDFERLGDAAYIPVAIAGQGAFYKLFYMAAYNVDAGDMLLNEAWGFDWTHESDTTGLAVNDFSAEKDGRYRFLYADDSEDAFTNIVTYTNAWGARPEKNEGAYATYHPASSQPTVLISGQTKNLNPGNYRYNFDLNTQLVCDPETPVVTVRAMGKKADGERTELAHYDYTAAESAQYKMHYSYTANDWEENMANNWGPQYCPVKLDFSVEEAMTVDFEVVVYNNADVRLRSVELTGEQDSAQMQGEAMAEAILKIGEINAANCLTKADELNEMKEELEKYIADFGQEKADRYIPNQAALNTALEQANALKEARLAARDKVQEAVAAVAALSVSSSNYEECEPAVVAAEEAIKGYVETYGQEAVNDLADADKVTAAREAIDKFKNTLYGDLTGEGNIDASDALKVLQYSVKLIDLTDDQKLAADVNEDSRIDATDALRILQYSVKLITKLPA